MLKPSFITYSKSEAYIDPNFPPTRLSIHNPATTSTKQNIIQVCERAVWRRPREIFKSDAYTLFGLIGPQVVHQGVLADCYYLSCVSSLAKVPERIRRLFADCSKSNSGCYLMHGFINGIKRIFSVDDYLLFDPSTNLPGFAQPDTKEIWVLLLEKLWAKVNGSFTNIEYGEEIEALNFLAGAPVDCHIHATMTLTIQQLWDRIIESDKKGHVLVGSTKQHQPEEEYRKLGLAQFHVYSILQAISLVNDGKTVEVLVLRDPWHKSDWKGEYSKYSSKWQAVAGYVLYTDPDSFVILFSDYLKYFKETTICKYYDEYVHSYAEVQMENFASYCFETTKPFNGYISLYQYHPRMVKLKLPNYTYAPIFLILGQMLENGAVKYVTSMLLTEQSVYREVCLVPGRYVVFTGKDGEMANTPYSITLYGDCYIELKSAIWEWKCLAGIVTEYAERNKTKWKKISEGLYHFDTARFELGFGASLIKYEQAGGKGVYYEEVMEYVGLRRLYPKIRGKVKVYLENGESLTVIYMFCSTKSYSYNYCYQFRYL